MQLFVAIFRIMGSLILSIRRLEAPLRSRLQLAYNAAAVKGLVRAATVELVDAVQGSASFASANSDGEAINKNAVVTTLSSTKQK